MSSQHVRDNGGLAPLIEVRPKRIGRTRTDEQSRVDAARLLREAIAASGLTFVDVAASVGVTAGRVEDWCDENHPHSLPMHRRLCLPARVLLALQELELALIQRRAAGLSTAHYSLELSERVGERARMVREAMADGVVDDAERRSIRAVDLQIVEAARRALADR